MAVAGKLAEAGRLAGSAARIGQVAAGPVSALVEGQGVHHNNHSQAAVAAAGTAVEDLEGDTVALEEAAGIVVAGVAEVHTAVAAVVEEGSSEGMEQV